MPAPVVPRLPDLAAWLSRKSCFLLGPRQTGKSSLVRHALPRARVYDLLDSAVYLALGREPGLLARELTPRDKVVVLDEIQRLPSLLDDAHHLTESRGIRFLMIGSSARRLQRGSAKLWGGRARMRSLHPLTARELGTHFDLTRAIQRGTLPAIYFADDPRAALDAYAGAYLREEIMDAGAVRNLPAFSRFLRAAALSNATRVNFTSLASDAQVPRTTIYEYLAILQETQILHEVPAWRASVRRKPIASSKYYFFDVGVVSALQGRLVKPGTPEFGAAVETWLLHELMAHRDYAGGGAVSHWRSTSGFDVNFVLGDHTAITVTARHAVSPRDLRGLRALMDERLLKRYLCVALDPRRRQVDGITILPVAQFLDGLWGGEFGG